MPLFLGLIFSCFFNLWAQEISVPALTSPVMDEASLLSESERQDLSGLAYEIYTHQGPQITILTVQSLEGLAIEDYSMKVAEKWQLGTKEKGNGILILISKEPRKVRIEVGEGIEGEITDYDSNKWIRNILAPSFKQNDFHGGLRAVMEAIAGKFSVEISESGSRFVRPAPQRRSGPLNAALPFMIIAFVVIQIVMNKHVAARGVASAAGVAGIGWFMLPGVGLAFIVVLFIIGLLFGLIGLSNLLYILTSSSGGGRGGGFGGGSGGSWSGGGGGFSGGGSSGDW